MTITARGRSNAARATASTSRIAGDPGFGSGDGDVMSVPDAQSRTGNARSAALPSFAYT